MMSKRRRMKRYLKAYENRKDSDQSVFLRNPAEPKNGKSEYSVQFAYLLRSILVFILLKWLKVLLSSDPYSIPGDADFYHNRGLLGGIGLISNVATPLTLFGEDYESVALSVRIQRSCIGVCPVLL